MRFRELFTGARWIWSQNLVLDGDRAENRPLTESVPPFSALSEPE